MAGVITGFDLKCKGVLDVKEFMELSKTIYEHLQAGDLCPGYKFIRFSGSPTKSGRASVYAYYSYCERYFDKDKKELIVKSIKQTPKITFYDLDIRDKFRFYLNIKEFEYLFEWFEMWYSRGIKKVSFEISNRIFKINNCLDLFIYDF
ncbi:MAG: hypothetical protein JHC31_15000 [Sulfurihydrogenibium sp.]|nr:hypothetical protein [Sulfurihydrogenibium sp.]